MYETIQLILGYMRMIWRYRWIALVAATVLCAGGWIAVLSMPDRYEVSAKVFLDTSTLLKPLLRGLARLGVTPNGLTLLSFLAGDLVSFARFGVAAAGGVVAARLLRFTLVPILCARPGSPPRPGPTGSPRICGRTAGISPIRTSSCSPTRSRCR